MSFFTRQVRTLLLTVAAVIVAIGLFGCLGDDAKYKRGSFTDDRDGQMYATTTINGKTWMAENLNYLPETNNSWCYDDNNSYCNQYGRLYDWETARIVCPSGWHLPSSLEWDDLIDAVKEGGRDLGVRHLKTKSGWNDRNGTKDDGSDEYGFSALPGGYREYTGAGFYDVGDMGLWWTATTYSESKAYRQEILSGSGFFLFIHNYDKRAGYSVRCVKN